MKDVIYLLLVLNGVYLLLQNSDIPSSNKYTSFKPASIFICVQPANQFFYIFLVYLYL